MSDPFFAKTVTFICTHNQDGAMGLVINRETDITIGNSFAQIKLSANSQQLKNKTVHYGGPVQTDRGFILHSPSIEYNSTVVVNEQVALTTSKDILEAASENKAPESMLIALGYAGWTPGQLEDEMRNNSWLSLDTADSNQIHKLIFNANNHDKYEIALQLMGLNFANLSEVAGHA